MTNLTVCGFSRARRVLPYLMSAILLLAFTRRAPADDLETWLQTENAVAATKLASNTLGNGAVIASPSRDNPNYFFHWVRDAELTMDVVVSEYIHSRDAADQTRYFSLLTSYLDFSLRNQITTNLSSSLGRGLGEPKFNTDGAAFDAPWGRPQDDGPALRAVTFTRLANFLLDSGAADKVQLVKIKLYDSVLPTSSLIKRDLEYVSHNWQKTCFDLWEETQGHHFYTRIVQRRALVEGAKLARRLDDPGAADWYTAQAGALETEIRKHWNQGQGIISATLDRDGGIDYKSSGLDTAVILGVLHAHLSGDDFFSPTSDMVLATASKLATKFGAIYDINRIKDDGAGGTLGIAIGRYPEDRYGGEVGTSEGNPWVLCTLALAELYYRATREWERSGQLRLTDANTQWLASINADKFRSLTAGQALSKDAQAFRDITAEVKAAAARQLRRVKYHAFSDGSLSEQMNRHSGFMQSARDLTWNCASVITTLSQRGSAAPVSPLNLVTPVSRSSFNRAGMFISGTNPTSLPLVARPGSIAELHRRISELEATVKALSAEVRGRRKEGSTRK